MKLSPIFILSLCAVLNASVFKIENNLRTEKIKVSGSFDAPTIEKNREGKLQISLDSLPHTMEAGLPSVPFKTFKIALPSGKEWDRIEVTDGLFMTTIRGQVERASSQIPISWIGTKPNGLVKTEAPDYSKAYPQNIFSFSRQYLHGVEILIVNIFPVIEVNHESIETYSKVTLSISYKNSLREKATLFAHQRAEVKSFVDNAETIDSYSSRAEKRPGLDYLILATPKVVAYSGVNSLNDLVKGLSSRGINAKIVSLTTIDNQSEGTDRVEKIRNYIKKEYSANGIQYVLMVGKAMELGTEPYFPARALWSKLKAYMGYWTTIEENIPSDAYYSFLDGTFNGNGNDKWGEADDGDNGGDVDFLPEVTVGRVAVSSDSQLQNFVRKTLFTYNNKAVKETALLGEELFSELNLYGDDYMDQLVGACSDHNYSTEGYSSSWKLVKFYDKFSSWDGEEAQRAISAGNASMVNHLGHSNNTTNMKLSSSDIPGFRNTKPFMYYTQGCLAAKYTVGSFVDKMVTATNAAVAAVGNSSYGLAPEDPQPATTKTPGGSQMLHRQFIDGIFTKNIKAMGKAHQASKVAFIGLKDTQEVRWVNWTVHYFGDPSLEMNF